MKRSSLLKRVSEFTPKKFYRFQRLVSRLLKRLV